MFDFYLLYRTTSNIICKETCGNKLSENIRSHQCRPHSASFALHQRKTPFWPSKLMFRITYDKEGTPKFMFSYLKKHSEELLRNEARSKSRKAKFKTEIKKRNCVRDMKAKTEEDTQVGKLR